MDNFDKYHRIILSGILAFSLLIRIVNLPWGLSLFDAYIGETYYHPDEFKVALGGKKIVRDILTRTDLRYPTAMHYIIGIAYLPIKSMALPIEDSQILFVLGRTIASLFGVASIACAYLLGKHLSGQNPTAGLLASGLLAVSLYHIRSSGLATTDAAVSFWGTAFLVKWFGMNEKSRMYEYMLLGTLFGFLVGTKYTGAFFAIPFGILLLRRYLVSPTTRRQLFLGAILFSVTGVIVFLLTTPSILLHPSAFFDSLKYESNRIAALRADASGLDALTNFAASLSASTNSLFTAIIFLAILLAIIRRANENITTLVILICMYYAYFNAALLTRYWVMLLPALSALAAWGLASLSRENGLWRYASPVLYALTLIWGIYQAAQLIELARNDTRSAATKYISENLSQNVIHKVVISSKKDDASIHLPTNGDLPDYILLSDFENAYPITDELSLASNAGVAHYKRTRLFLPANDLRVEFMSPTIQIFSLQK